MSEYATPEVNIGFHSVNGFDKVELSYFIADDRTLLIANLFPSCPLTPNSNVLELSTSTPEVNLNQDVLVLIYFSRLSSRSFNPNFSCRVLICFVT